MDQDYSVMVYRSIMKRELYLGIPLIPLVLLGFFTIIMVFNLQQIGFLAVTVILWVILKILTDKDEYLLDIILSSLFQPDILEP